MSLPLSICFFCFVNGISKWTETFKYYFLLPLSGAVAVPVFASVIVPSHVCMNHNNCINLTLTLKF